MKTANLITLITLLISIKGYTQSISENTSYPTATQVKCEYKFNGGGGIYFDNWTPPTNSVIIDNSGSLIYLQLKWKNVEASAGKSMLIARYHNSQNYPINVTTYVGPFQLSFPNPTFLGGSTKNIPCHSTDPVVISLNSYTNTAANGIDQGETITSHFRWTLPSGWQTTGGKTGTFDAYSSITVIPPLSSSTEAIFVQPYADAGQGTQFGPNVSLQITRNLASFSITGPTSVVFNSTYRYAVPSYPGISYSWQLPAGWTGSSNTNFIDVKVGCNPGLIVATMNGCNGPKSKTLTITPNIIVAGTQISGHQTVCSTGSNFSVPDNPEGTTITWNSSTNLTLSYASSNNCTFSANSSGDGWIEATIHAPACGTSITLPRKTVWAGIPIVNYISGTQHVEQSGFCEPYMITPGNAGTTYEWWVVPTWGTIPCIVNNYGNSANICFPEEGDYRVYAKATNTCGPTTAELFVSVGAYEPYIIYPNPGDDNITLQASTIETMAAKSLEVGKSRKAETYDVKILNEQGTLMKTQQTKQLPLNIQTNNLPNGKYILQVLNKGKVWNKQLLIKH